MNNVTNDITNRQGSQQRVHLHMGPKFLAGNKIEFINHKINRRLSVTKVNPDQELFVFQ